MHSVPPAYNTGPWQGNTTSASKNGDRPRNSKSTGRVRACKGTESVEHATETGVQEQDSKKRRFFTENAQAKGVH